MKYLLRMLVCLLLALSLSVSPLADAPYPEESETQAETPELPNEGTDQPTGGGEEDPLKPFDVDAKAAILMDAATGRILGEWNADEALPPASVTKIMTMLLVMEAIDGGKIALSDSVQVSEYAASMGGSQVFLKAGEQMCVEELLKSVVIASANDAAVALAELVSGDVDRFVAEMNKRAGELGMANSHFENPTGLDDSTVNHVFSARDIAIASRELITKHPTILNYSSIWMDSIRDGAFGLTNTNRLVRFYRGATGLKTGSTSKALFCMSATATRDGLSLIAVVMGAKTRDERNELAKKLLDYGFSHYEMAEQAAETLDRAEVLGGKTDSVSISHQGASFLVEKGKGALIERRIELPERLSAPIEIGQQVGEIIWSLNGEELGRCSILADESVARLGVGDLFLRLLRAFCFRFGGDLADGG